jgi:hypothetical protein
MIGAMTAAVSAVSTLVSGAAALSGESALAAEAGPLEATGAGACAALAIKATGFTETEGEVLRQQRAHCLQARPGGLQNRPQMPSAPRE